MLAPSTLLLVVGVVSLLPRPPVAAAGGLPAKNVRDTYDGGMVWSDSRYPVGDPRRCLQESASNNFLMERFEVLPGNGWDNLRNVEQGQVVAFNFSQCRTTDDGRFLLPDTVTAVPLKKSRLQVFAELIASWKDWTSVTSRSVNMDAGLEIPDISISGRFSASFEDMKSKLVGDKTLATRTQARYIRYSVHLQPDTPLHPTFRGRLLEVAAAHKMQDPMSARYLAQLLVRDFGTHVITSADAGAALIQVDHVKEDWMKENSAKKSEILSFASASLYSVFNMKTSFNSTATSNFQSDYSKQRTSSVVETFGGPLYRPTNFTLNQWAQEADRDLVALDRSGDPLHYFVTAATLPELPASIITEVQRSVLEAVETYYTYNVIPGCLQRDSPNFSPSANVDDGSCLQSTSQVTFGGMYQTCALKPGSDNGNLCEGMTQQNPLTGDFSCPGDYEPVLLLQGDAQARRTEKSCSRYLLFWKRCTDTIRSSVATTSTYWCATMGSEGSTSAPGTPGYLFGGLYTSFIPNPVTQSPSCPPGFLALHVGSARDLHVCISEDLEVGAKGAVPFAGFVSCRAGNPFAFDGDAVNRLLTFYKTRTDEWPQRCPQGYSKHLATVDQGCQVSYCVRTGAMAGLLLPPVQRPPFVMTPAVIYVDPSANEKQTSTEMMTGDRPLQAVTPEGAAGMAVGACTGSVLLVLAVTLLVRYRRRRGEQAYHRLEESLIIPKSCDFGSSGNVSYSEI